MVQGMAFFLARGLGTLPPGWRRALFRQNNVISAVLAKTILNDTYLDLPNRVMSN